MDITQSIRYRQTGWSLGYCASCQGVNPARIEDQFRVTSLYLIPMSSQHIGQVARCDFCERLQISLVCPQYLAVGDWKRSDDTARLAELLGVALPVDGVKAEQQLTSLLLAAEEESSLSNVEVTSGLTIGVVCGGLIGGFLGWGMHPRWLPQLDLLGACFAGVLGGLVTGGVMFAIISAIWQHLAKPVSKLRCAYGRYRFDARELLRLAERRSWRVRRAARMLVDAPPIGQC